MKPIITFLKDLFVSQKIIGDNKELKGLVKADVLLKELIKEKKVPGLAITVSKGENIVFQKGYGYADMENKVPIDPQNTLFRIASVSKPIAATALAKMVEEGQMDLDASLYQYVPYFPKKKYDFTIRQLAGHTAGIRGYRGKEYGLNEPYTIKEGISVFKEDSLLFEPGTDYHYNSYDWSLISLAMQEASGVPFEAYVQKKVLDTLEMRNTFPETIILDNGEENRRAGDRTAIFYSKNRLGFRKAMAVNNFYKLAGGGYLSTSEDIARLGSAYLSRKMGSDRISQQFRKSVKIKGELTYYGLGWQVSEDNAGRSYYGHVGNGVGGYANFYVYPKEDMVFSILINCTDPKVQPILDEAIALILETQTRIQQKTNISI